MSLKNKLAEHDRFFIVQTYCRQLVDLFQQAVTKQDPALFLYQQKARGPLFMLESLLRLLQAAYPGKGIKEAGKIIKKLEDLLGVIDSQDQLCQHFSKYEAIDKKQLAYFEAKRNKAIFKLNKKLLKHNFYQDIFNTLITQAEINFDNDKLIPKLEEEMKWELKAALHFYMGYPSGFKNMETDVHELRRKLRWISIYAQSLQGIMLAKPLKTNYAWEEEFARPEIKNAAYNTLPVKKNLAAYIVINQKAFRALNFVIERLGEIKDKGLAMKALHKSILKTQTKDKEKATKLVTKELKLTYSEKDLLKEAHQLLHKFFIDFKIQDALFPPAK